MYLPVVDYVQLHIVHQRHHIVSISFYTLGAYHKTEGFSTILSSVDFSNNLKTRANVFGSAMAINQLQWDRLKLWDTFCGQINIEIYFWNELMQVILWNIRIQFRVLVWTIAMLFLIFRHFWLRSLRKIDMSVRDTWMKWKISSTLWPKHSKSIINNQQKKISNENRENCINWKKGIESLEFICMILLFWLIHTRSFRLRCSSHLSVGCAIVCIHLCVTAQLMTETMQKNRLTKKACSEITVNHSVNTVCWIDRLENAKWITFAVYCQLKCFPPINTNTSDIQRARMWLWLFRNSRFIHM